MYLCTSIYVFVIVSVCVCVCMCVFYCSSLCPQSVNGNLKELFPVGTQQVEPLVAQLRDQRLLLQRDKMSIFINAEGEPTQREPINWSDIPIAIGMWAFTHSPSIGPTSALLLKFLVDFFLFFLTQTFS